MSSSRGIFETFNNQSSEDGTARAQHAPSPFAVATDQPEQRSPQAGAAAPAAEFAPAPEAPKASPFAIVPENEERDVSGAVRLPERRKPAETPFQMAEPQGFGFEAQPQSKVSPLESAPSAPAPQQASPASPFSIDQSASSPAPAPAQNPFGGWPQADATPAPPAPQAAFAQHPVAAPAQSPIEQPSVQGSDSYSIKQLELRAIFGVDREMTTEEILQRSRSLPGIRQIARVDKNDISTVDAMKQVISNLGFGSGAIKLYSRSVPIEFIREGEALLAVQTDGGFAPGVRETLMIVARELGR